MSSIPPIIVIVEDSRVQGRILQQRLNAAGYEAHIGENGELALQLVHKLKPAVVISDNEMPKMNGYELCSEMPHKPF